MKWNEGSKRLKEVILLDWVNNWDEREFRYPANASYQKVADMVNRGIQQVQDDWHRLHATFMGMESEDLHSLRAILEFSSDEEEKREPAPKPNGPCIRQSEPP